MLMDQGEDHAAAHNRSSQYLSPAFVKRPEASHHPEYSLAATESPQHPLDGHYSPLVPESFQKPNPSCISASELDNSTSTAPMFTSRSEKCQADGEPESNEYDELFDLPNFGQEGASMGAAACKSMPGDVKPQLGMLPPLSQAGRWQPPLLSARQFRTYGTFTIDSARGRLFELDAYLRFSRQECRAFLWYVLVATLFWPVIWLFAICTSYRAATTERRDLQMLSAFLVMGALTGLVLWLGPSLFMAWGGAVHGGGAWTGTLHYISDLLFNAEVTTFDFVTLALAQILFFFFLAFAWTYHQIARDMEGYKISTESSWAMRQDSWGHHFVIPDDQRGHLSAFLRLETPRPQLNKMYLRDIVTLLQQMPGWDPSSDFKAKDHEQEICGASCGFFSKLQEDSEAAVRKGLWSHDVYVMWSRQYEEYVPLGSRLYLMCSKTYALMAYVASELSRMPLSLFCVIVICLMRVMLPRLWLWIVLDGMLFPKQIAPQYVVALGCLVTFITSFFWIGLFVVIIHGYGRNISQSMLISGLIDPQSRIEYARQYLHGYSKNKVENIMCCMPLVGLMHAANVSAYWRLRQYGVLDRAKMRMAMEVLMDMLVIWLLSSVMVVLILMWTFQPYTAWAPVIVLDLVVFGGLALRALHISLKVSEAQNKHMRVFAESQYDVAQKCAELKEGACATARMRDTPSPTITDLESTSALLTKYMSMVREDDSCDTLLLGVKVTPAAVLSVAALGCTVLVMICIKISALGIFSMGQPQQQTIRMLNTCSAMSNALRHTLHWLHMA